MDTVDGERQELGLGAVRSRGVVFIKYGVWAMVFAFIATAITLYLAILQRWLALLESVRQILGIHRPATGPDWWLFFGLGVALILPIVAGLVLYWRYQRAWIRRLRELWQASRLPVHAKVRLLRSGATEAEPRIAYLRALCGSPVWRAANIPDPGTSADSYEAASEAILKELERDVCQRSIMLGLTVGVSHNRAVDLVTIGAAAFEVQLHVLTRLGKRPSLALWKQMLTRTISSMFISSYLNANESLALRIAIKKMGMGLEVASDWIDHATSVGEQHLSDLFDHASASDWNLDDADWDDADHLVPHSVAGIPVKAIVEGLGFVAGGLVSVGSFGLRQLGVFIDKAGDELFQGAVAGGILYFHGMAIAADCLALDPAHRQSSQMTRTFGQCVRVSSEVAGEVLRAAVRRLRIALREKRRRALTYAKDKAMAGGSHVAGWVSEQSRHAGEHIHDAAKATDAAVGGLAKEAAHVSASIWDGTRAAGCKAAEFTAGVSRDVAAKVHRLGAGEHLTDDGDGAANAKLPNDGTKHDLQHRATTFVKDKAQQGASHLAETVGVKLKDAGEHIHDAAKATDAAVGGLAKEAAHVSASIWDGTRAAGCKAAEFTAGVSRDVAAKVHRLGAGEHLTDDGDGAANAKLPNDGTKHDLQHRATTFVKDKAQQGASHLAETVGVKLKDAGEHIHDAAKATDAAVGGLAKEAAHVSASIWDGTRAAGCKAAEFTAGVSRTIAAKVRNLDHGAHGDGSATNTPLSDDGSELKTL